MCIDDDAMYTPYALPKWVMGHTVRVDAGPGTAVELCDMDNLSYNRVAKFVRSVGNSALKAVKANNGGTLDFSRPHSMRVLTSTTNLGCITALATVDRFCMPAGQKALLPAWIIQAEVQVEAVAGVAVTLCDFMEPLIQSFGNIYRVRAELGSEKSQGREPGGTRLLPPKVDEGILKSIAKGAVAAVVSLRRSRRST